MNNVKIIQVGSQWVAYVKANVNTDVIKALQAKGYEVRYVF